MNQTNLVLPPTIALDGRQFLNLYGYIPRSLLREELALSSDTPQLAAEKFINWYYLSQNRPVVNVLFHREKQSS